MTQHNDVGTRTLVRVYRVLPDLVVFVQDMFDDRDTVASRMFHSVQLTLYSSSVYRAIGVWQQDIARDLVFTVLVVSRAFSQSTSKHRWTMYSTVLVMGQIGRENMSHTWPVVDNHSACVRNHAAGYTP